uniref:F-box domain-containing protein n=1 Tax=Kalanchoe fedtschenkoi TaxID=63787 RepID=A0A7N0UII1_KALFE
MNRLDWSLIQAILPDDIALKIASSLEVSDVCALSGCSRFWRELCGSDRLWISLCRRRWPEHPVFNDQTSVAESYAKWKNFYAEQHLKTAERVKAVVDFVDLCLTINIAVRGSSAESIEAGNYLKAIASLSSMNLGFVDVQLFLLKPNVNVLLNLIGLHYCLSWLEVEANDVLEALKKCKISERQVCVKWWKLGRWFHGFRLRDEFNCRWMSLQDLAVSKEEEVLSVLRRGAIHEVLRVQISMANPTPIPWSCQIIQASRTS